MMIYQNNIKSNHNHQQNQQLQSQNIHQQQQENYIDINNDELENSQNQTTRALCNQNIDSNKSYKNCEKDIFKFEEDQNQTLNSHSKMSNQNINNLEEIVINQNNNKTQQVICQFCKQKNNKDSKCIHNLSIKNSYVGYNSSILKNQMSPNHNKRQSSDDFKNINLNGNHIFSPFKEYQNQDIVDSNKQAVRCKKVETVFEKKARMKNTRMSKMGQLFQSEHKNISKLESQKQKEEELKIQKQACEKIGNARKIQTMNKIKEKFFQHLDNLELRRYKLMNIRYINFINDLATVDLWNTKVKQKKGSTLCVYLLKLLIKPLILIKFILIQLLKAILYKKNCINPQSQIAQIMYWVELINIFVVLITYNLYIFFGFKNYNVFAPMQISGITIFAVGSLFRLNCGFYHNGNFVEDVDQRINKYFKQYFFPDFISLGAVIFNIYQYSDEINAMSYFGLFIFAKCITFYRLAMEKEEQMNLNGISFYKFELFKLLFQTLVLCHVCATLYHAIGKYELDTLEDENNWLSQAGIEDAEWNIRYLESFYWSLSTVMLVGSKGYTFLETAFCCITLISTVGIFATILSKIAITLEDMDRQTKDYRNDLKILNDMFDNNLQFSNSIQMQLLNYLKYLYIGHQEMKSSEELKNVLSKFPLELQQKTQREKYQVHIDKFYFFKENFSQELVDKLVEIIEEEYYMPNQLIQQKGEYQEPKLSLVMKGKAVIEEHFNNQDYQYYDLGPGQFFGETSFFLKCRKNNQYRSTDFTTLLTIKRSKFEDLLHKIKNKRDIEIFHIFQHQFVTTGWSKKMSKFCYICKKSSHKLEQCNLLHFQPERAKLILKYNQSTPEKERNKNYKRVQRKYTYKPILMIKCLEENRHKILEDTEMRTYLKILQTVLKESDRLIFKKFQDTGFYDQQLVNQEKEDFTDLILQHKNEEDLGQSIQEILKERNLGKSKKTSLNKSRYSVMKKKSKKLSSIQNGSQTKIKSLSSLKKISQETDSSNESDITSSITIENDYASSNTITSEEDEDQIQSNYEITSLNYGSQESLQNQKKRLTFKSQYLPGGNSSILKNQSQGSNQNIKNNMQIDALVQQQIQQFFVTIFEQNDILKKYMPNITNSLNFSKPINPNQQKLRKPTLKLKQEEVMQHQKQQHNQDTVESPVSLSLDSSLDSLNIINKSVKYISPLKNQSNNNNLQSNNQNKSNSSKSNSETNINIQERPPLKQMQSSKKKKCSIMMQSKNRQKKSSKVLKNPTSISEIHGILEQNQNQNDVKNIIEQMQTDMAQTAFKPNFKKNSLSRDNQLSVYQKQYIMQQKAELNKQNQIFEFFSEFETRRNYKHFYPEFNLENIYNNYKRFQKESQTGVKRSLKTITKQLQNRNIRRKIINVSNFANELKFLSRNKQVDAESIQQLQQQNINSNLNEDSKKNKQNQLGFSNNSNSTNKNFQKQKLNLSNYINRPKFNSVIDEKDYDKSEIQQQQNSNFLNGSIIKHTSFDNQNKEQIQNQNQGNTNIKINNINYTNEQDLVMQQKQEQKSENQIKNDIQEVNKQQRMKFPKNSYINLLNNESFNSFNQQDEQVDINLQNKQANNQLQFQNQLKINKNNINSIDIENQNYQNNK